MHPRVTDSALAACRLALAVVAPQQTGRAAVGVSAARLVHRARLVEIFLPNAVVEHAVLVAEVERTHRVSGPVPPRDAPAVGRVDELRVGKPVAQTLAEFVDETVVTPEHWITRRTRQRRHMTVDPHVDAAVVTFVPAEVVRLTQMIVGSSIHHVLYHGLQCAVTLFV